MKICPKTFCALPFFLSSLPLAADDTPEWIDQIADSLRTLSHSEIKVTVPSEDDWRQFLAAISAALNSGSTDDLASLKPQAEAALEYLDNVPSAKPYADWLRQRLDYFEVADELQRTAPPAAKPTPSKPVTKYPALPTNKPPASIVPKPQPAWSVPPAMQAVTAQSPSRYARISAIWQRQVSRRIAPQNSGVLVPRLKKIFRGEGVPEQLVWLAEVESTMNPQARSPAGAAGLFQMMPQTAKRFGLRLAPPPDERLDPDRQARATAQYLRFLNLRFGNWPLALAAYNAGEGRVSKAMNDTGGKNFESIASLLSAETQMYVPKIDAVLLRREGTGLDRLPVVTPSHREN
jgi:membrane-bound lytic murein transglycosylase D